MKKLVLFAVLAAFSVLQTQAIPVMSYSNKCFVGCGSVFWTTKIYTGPDNVSFIGADVKCRGFGIHGCPSVNVGVDAISVSGVSLLPWENTPINTVVNQAWLEMDLGIANGSYSVNYTNVSTGSSYRYMITWNTTFFIDGSIDEVSYVIDRTELPSSVF